MNLENNPEISTGVEAPSKSRTGNGEDAFIHHRLEELARSRPDFVALKNDATQYTFAAFDGLANHVARELRSRIPDREALIAVWSTEPALQLIFTFGVWKAGLTAVILDTRDTETRLHRVLDHAGVDAVIADTGSAREASRVAASATVLQIDPRGAAATAPDADVAPDAPALIVFTSGSEGEPRGVVRTHRGLLLESRYHGSELEMRSEDRVAQLLPLNFSSGLGKALTSVVRGATLCFYDILSQGLEPFYEWVQREGITVLPSPIAFFRRVLHHASRPDTLASCRYVVLGGDKVFRSDVENFRRVFPRECLLVHTYGTTECGVIARHVIRGDTTVADLVPLGTGVEDKEIRILSHGLREMPVDEMGQIAVLGSNLPPGYWKDPEATERKYKSSPDNDGRRMYLTGDVGKIGEDGQLYLYRRNDKQLKVRGYRVDLSEIEAVLNSDEHVVHAVVMTSEEEGNEPKIVAYVTLSGAPEEHKALTHALKQRTAGSLPTYMVPDEFVVLDIIPTTPGGKTDRRTLSAGSSSTARANKEESLTETEQKVIELWKQVFKKEDLALDDDILELGVKSLAGMEMCLLLARKFSIDVPYAQLTVSPTARGLAAFIDGQLAAMKEETLNRGTEMSNRG